MKSLICSVILFFGVLGQINAQSLMGVRFGGNAAGFDHSQQAMNLNTESDPKIGMTGGIKMDFDLAGDWLSASPELFFIQNGSKEYLALDQLTNINNIINMDYVGMMLPLRINIGEDKLNGLALFGSFFADYTINATANETNGFAEKELAFNGMLDKIDFGYALGIEFVTNGFMIQVGYNKGLKNIQFYVPQANNDQTYLVNNKGLTLAVGYIAELY